MPPHRFGTGRFWRWAALVEARKASWPGTTRPPPPASKIASAYVIVFTSSSTKAYSKPVDRFGGAFSKVPRRFQWYIAEGMLSLPTAKWSMVISFFSGVMASGFAFGCAKDTVEFFNAGIGEVRFPVGEGFLLVIFDYVLNRPMGLRKPRHDAYTLR